MPARTFTSIVGVAIMVIVTACSTVGAESPVPSSSAATRASTYLEFRAGFCAAWSDLTRAIGNPETGTGSELTIARDDAIEAGDLAAVDRLTRTITATLTAGRDNARYAGGWAKAAAAAEAMDPLFVAFQAMVVATRDAAVRGEESPRMVAQEEFERVGGVDAWFDMVQVMQGDAIRRAIADARPPDLDPQCPGVPVSI